MQVSVGVSNRHVHLTEEVYQTLFDVPMEKIRDLNQIGEFASNQFVTLKTDKSEIPNVRILGPFRDYNQVEVSRTDAYLLGIDPPVRKSGDLNNSASITLIGSKGSVFLKNSCIIADRHIHMPIDMAEKLHLSDGQVVKVLVEKEKSCILFVNIKVSENGFYELHLDFDDANAAGLKNGDILEVIL